MQGAAEASVAKIINRAFGAESRRTGEQVNSFCEQHSACFAICIANEGRIRKLQGGGRGGRRLCDTRRVGERSRDFHADER